METMARVAALAALAAFLCVLLRERERTLALLLSAAACVLGLLLTVRMVEPILSVAREIQELSGLGTAVTAPLFKVTAIGILCRIAAGVCGDAGEQGLQKAVELSGSLLALYAALPLVSAVLALLEDMLGG